MVKQHFDALVGDLVDRESYWEQWGLVSVPETKRPCTKPGTSMKRYKSWVLMTITKQQFAARVQQTADLLRREASAPNTSLKVVSDH
jgi:hypothetical protein